MAVAVQRMWNDRPQQHGSLVRRTALVRRLADAQAPPLTVIVAPAGYGKTTLLRDWAERDGRPFAWVTASECGDDGDRLRQAVSRAIADAVGDAPSAPFILVIDEGEALRSDSSLEALAAVADTLPPRARLAIASRRQLGLPLARLRAHRLVAELGAADLALSRAEAAKLLGELGHRLGPEDLAALLHGTEGWPAGLMLASLFLSELGGRPNVARFGGSDRLVVDYVRDELLRDTTDDVRAFLRRTSILDVLSGPLCDAVTDAPGSAVTLAGLAREGLVRPLDRSGEHYRLHRLVAEALRASLRRLEPALEPVLHARAGAWHARNGDVNPALQHLLAAGELAAAGELVWSCVGDALATGRHRAVERWLSRFTAAQVAEQPRLALVAAGTAVLQGRGHVAEHWAALAARGSLEAGVAVMRAAVASDGARQMRADARGARELQPDGGAGRGFACLLAGVASRWLGEGEDAVARLAEGARHAAVSAPLAHALCLAELALVAVERGDWDEAWELSERAHAQLERHGDGDVPLSALVYAVSAVVRAHRGRTDEAQACAHEAARLQAGLTGFSPLYGLDVRLLLARAAVRLGDVRTAREQLGEAARLLRKLPEAGAAQAGFDDTQRLVEAGARAGIAEPAPITAAELRVLRYLPTHLSFREIAERTHVSANTVKSQVNAVYRKFGVACRSDAVARARSCGLLDEAGASPA